MDADAINALTIDPGLLDLLRNRKTAQTILTPHPGEAARLLGAPLPRRIWVIALPLARPALAAGVALALMETLADFGVSSYFGIQTFTAGYEGLQAQGVPAGVQVANAGDAWSPAVAEHGMAMLLALVKRLPKILVQQANREWNRSVTSEMGSLIGQTLVVVGFGSIGQIKKCR